MRKTRNTFASFKPQLENTIVLNHLHPTHKRRAMKNNHNQANIANIGAIKQGLPVFEKATMVALGEKTVISTDHLLLNLTFNRSSKNINELHMSKLSI